MRPTPRDVHDWFARCGTTATAAACLTTLHADPNWHIRHTRGVRCTRSACFTTQPERASRSRCSASGRCAIPTSLSAGQRLGRKHTESYRAVEERPWMTVSAPSPRIMVVQNRSMSCSVCGYRPRSPHPLCPLITSCQYVRSYTRGGQRGAIECSVRTTLRGRYGTDGSVDERQVSLWQSIPTPGVPATDRLRSMTC